MKSASIALCVARQKGEQRCAQGLHGADYRKGWRLVRASPQFPFGVPRSQFGVSPAPP